MRTGQSRHRVLVRHLPKKYTEKKEGEVVDQTGPTFFSLTSNPPFPIVDNKTTSRKKKPSVTDL